MKDIVTQTERTADDFYDSHSDMVKDNLLFRFNVTNGLADIGLRAHGKVSEITDATQRYLNQGETETKVTACIKRLPEAHSEGNLTAFLLEN